MYIQGNTAVPAIFATADSNTEGCTVEQSQAHKQSRGLESYQIMIESMTCKNCMYDPARLLNAPFYLSAMQQKNKNK